MVTSSLAANRRSFAGALRVVLWVTPVGYVRRLRRVLVQGRLVVDGQQLAGIAWERLGTEMNSVVF